MSWISDLFGKKIKTPKVEPLPEIDMDTSWAAEDELKKLYKRNGFLQTLMAGNKKPKLAGSSYLGAR